MFVDILHSIVFVHGLTGHREKTWTACGERELWPKSLLSADIPEARIITYGYDADVARWTQPAGQNTVREHARNLVNDLTALRRSSKSTGRPIILVAHSLGGLVCQDALLICVNPNEEAQRDVLLSTRGIAFLGTPHAGGNFADFAMAVANIIGVTIVKKPNKRLLRVLQKKSEALANIRDDFHTMVRSRGQEQQNNIQDRSKPIKLHAFTEEKPVTFLGRRVVDPDSARIPGYNSDTIPANHTEMTKFRERSDAGYKRVQARLRIWVDDDEGIMSVEHSLNVSVKL
ncbi:hypothetical protein AOQ84DRAFT_288903 [Glonium stellatum]|uniref:AB hydrolase-1 domain-containing protein n=1 Tax=Glonium stellatum TaxID=574774 RepID=A0A8E2F5D4_9PEZI|nr:hypothetical protein AOQ84DRAFT_288903 [Glonium stellatum]